MPWTSNRFKNWQCPHCGHDHTDAFPDVEHAHRFFGGGFFRVFCEFCGARTDVECDAGPCALENRSAGGGNP